MSDLGPEHVAGIGTAGGLTGIAARELWSRWRQAQRDKAQDEATARVVNAVDRMRHDFSESMLALTRELQGLRGDLSAVTERIDNTVDNVSKLEQRVAGQGHFNERQFAELREADAKLRERVASLESKGG